MASFTKTVNITTVNKADIKREKRAYNRAIKERDSKPVGDGTPRTNEFEAKHYPSWKAWIIKWTVIGCLVFVGYYAATYDDNQPTPPKITKVMKK